MTKELIRKTASRFLKTNCYHGEDIIDEDIVDDADNYLPLDEVFIGFSTRQKLNKVFKEGDIDQTQYNTVPEAAIAFYRESLFWIKWTCPVLFGEKQFGLTFSIKVVPCRIFPQYTQ